MGWRTTRVCSVLSKFFSGAHWEHKKQRVQTEWWKVQSRFEKLYPYEDMQAMVQTAQDAVFSRPRWINSWATWSSLVACFEQEFRLKIFQVPFWMDSAYPYLILELQKFRNGILKNFSMKYHPPIALLFSLLWYLEVRHFKYINFLCWSNKQTEITNWK